MFTISEGDYSDYCVLGIFKATKDFAVKETAKLFKEECGIERTGTYIIGETYKYIEYSMSFIGWLNKNNYFEEMDYFELDNESPGRYLKGGYEWDNKYD